ncbi:hypothetical protein DFH07DRAFT_819275 [Mycena maculata]|uniref:F-box domain-containing protein n=1 Tax=Mycena maculata TaxID=230809 RepID=A0AAD7J6G7_9AGAR|nr:hypothetical protein DFH07DRAFT_819275 [Mycena maculata]
MAAVTACPRCGFPDSAPEITAALPTSVYPHLRRSNAAPSESQHKEFLREIETTTIAISEIEDKMSRLADVWNDLAAQRQTLLDLVSDDRKVLSPFRTLPNELLSEIFVRCAERELSHKWNPRTDPEWVLVQVCSRWRAVAISTPPVWCHISIPDSPEPLVQYRRISSAVVEGLLSFQLERSAEAPLAVNCTARFPSREIIKTLFSVAHRWQDVRLHIPDSDIRDLQTHPSTTSFPQLRTLILCNEWGREDPCTLFKRTPLLEELGFGFHSLFRGPRTLQPLHALHLSQIRKLSLKGRRYQTKHILSVLRSTPDLVELSLDDYTQDSTDTFNRSTSITLRHLRTLSFHGSDTVILCHLTVPDLQELTINFPTRFADELSAFLTRTGSSLTHLTLRDAGIDRKTLFHALSLTPCLRYLVLYSSGYKDQQFMRALTCRPGEQNLVPSLVSLELGEPFGYEGGASLVEMLRSRCAPGSLRSVKFQGWPTGPSDPLAFHTLRRDQGLDIRLVD